MQSIPDLPDLVDTAVAQAAIRLAQSTESPSVFNHSVRSYLFGELLAVHEGMRRGGDYDSETLFLGCVLHDLGVGAAAPGKARFEVEGADLAAALLTEHGCDRAVIDGVWEAIALHTSGGVAERRGPLCYLVRSGVGMDFGRNADFVDDQIAAAIHSRYPRLSMASTLVDAIAAHAQRSPEAAPPYSMPGEVLRERRTDGTTLLELMASHGRWGD
jgi:HD domain